MRSKGPNCKSYDSAVEEERTRFQKTLNVLRVLSEETKIKRNINLYAATCFNDGLVVEITNPDITDFLAHKKQFFYRGQVYNQVYD